MTAVETLRAAVLARAFTHAWPEVTFHETEFITCTIKGESGWRSATAGMEYRHLTNLEDALNDWLFGVSA